MHRKKGSTGQKLNLAEARARGSASSRTRVALWCGMLSRKRIIGCGVVWGCFELLYSFIHRHDSSCLHRMNWTSQTKTERLCLHYHPRRNGRSTAARGR